ncbi:DUF6702 family protein [Fluviicola taffensis]|uniref:Uncharacterized protein n=1 Tax=Fluviicola taffensis (strain DSM 16823 / NCIMB 13979 / RW262) TaxID=755732 RepID=F2ICJ7_FLUTR|nr:DUF6702 family protein [Fluviicola taffensis]AEA45467.1 hypothetical protein Fluta_3496 [Fluviicola taffensis DSM 16823]
MKELLAVFTFFFVGLSANAHEFYFAFAEVEYNATSKKLEITLEVTAHDLEVDMKKSGIVLDKHIENQNGNTDFKKQLESHLSKGFEITTGDSSVSLKVIGFDVMPTGLLYVYLESTTVVPKRSIDFKFDLLMETFPNQQNKITFIRNNQKQTAVFLPTKRTESITL